MRGALRGDGGRRVCGTSHPTVTRPPKLTPEDAVHRWLDRQRMELADSSVSSYRRRLNHFLEWCQLADVERIGDLRPWDVGAFEDHRRAEVGAVSLNNELTTLRQLLTWAASRGLVDDDVVEAVDPPTVDAADEVRDSWLAPERGEAVLAAFRGGDHYGSREHAWMELAWWTGARVGALRGLDLGDVDLEEGHVRFRHRPDEDTPLKNGRDGERYVGIADEVCDAVRAFLRERPDVVDDYGRHPLFASTQGRVARSTLRDSCYWATHPCRYETCPHGRERPTCEWHVRTRAFRCPSARSPHELRSGSISWQLNRGVPIEVVAERVNATVPVIERHYDQERQRQRYEKRRSEHLDRLDIDIDDDQENDGK